MLGHVESSLATVAAACDDAERRDAIVVVAAALHATVSRDVADPQARRSLQRRFRRLAAGERRPPTAPLHPPDEIDAA